MGSAHYFLTDNLGAFLANLEARNYSNNVVHGKGWQIFSKILSDALVKYYGYPIQRSGHTPISIRVTYELVKHGTPLMKLARQLKVLNTRYRKTLPGWKTKRQPRRDVRHRRWLEIQRFLQKHGELIGCFKYQGDDRLTEGNHSFNLEIAATPQEQNICMEFIKALVESYSPEGITRRRRQADKPKMQRDGWIQRYALSHKNRGWTPAAVAREIQRELREGTWNQRSKLRYNLSENTIRKIAGLKKHLTHPKYSAVSSLC